MHLLFLLFGCYFFWLLVSINATRCPIDRLSWEERAKNFTCQDRGFVYHCILDDTITLVETCAARIPVPEGKAGCPVVRFQDGVAYHFNENSECPITNPHCPSGKSAYYSDQLYLYPACSKNQSERSNYGGNAHLTTIKYEDSTEKTSLVPKKEEEYESNTVLGVFLVLFAILFFASGTLNLWLLYHNRFRKNIKDRRNGTMKRGKLIS